MIKHNTRTDMPMDMASIEEFLWLEADLLDRRHYQEWLQLWAAGGLYVIPAKHDVTDFENSLNYAYDDDAMRSQRVKRLLGGRTISENHATRTVRSVSRLRVMSRKHDSIEVSSSLIIVLHKSDEQTILAANVSHVLLGAPQGFRIQRKVIRLADAEGRLPDLSFIL
jgi:3-phenylpropionate/cinnamic acid dioxygenase small subunit